MRYFASFVANGGSTYNNRPYEYSNKKVAIKDIRSIVYGNHFQQPYNTSRYMVWNDDGIIVASGYLHGNGCWSINYDEIGQRIYCL